jgi:glucan phosphoethanolaminetransferase (alkaline phosphatase superfamily)
MIQRKQSLYLLIVVILSVLFLTGSILKTASTTGNVLTVCIKGIYTTRGNSASVRTGQMIPFAVISVLIPVVSLITIFLYRNRKLQMKMTLLMLCLELLLVIAAVYYFLIMIKNPGGNVIPGYRSIIPLITIILTALAYRGIRKDEDLVKSYDRLR